MFSHSLSKPLLLIAGLFFSSAWANEPFRVCAQPENLPMSQQSSQSGFEIEVAQILAKEMNRPLEIKWIPQRDPSFYRQTLGAGQCDALMSVPTGLERVLTTRPWYRSGFAFVMRRNEGKIPNTFDDPRLKRMTIALPEVGDGDTPAGLALSRRGLVKNLRSFSILDPKQMTDAVQNKEADLAILWGPFAGWYSHQANGKLATALTPEKDSGFPLTYDMAIGLKKSNQDLKAKLDAAIEHQQEAIAAVLKKWQIPVRKL